jgi:CBS domain-containing protein
MKIRDIMKHRIETIAPDSNISSAARLMRDKDIGMLPVNQGGEIVGILTDRDITTRATANGSDPNDTLVRDVMSNEVFSCLDSDNLQDAARIMEEYQVRRIIVQNESGAFVGILSLADLAHHQQTEKLGTRVLGEVTQPHHYTAAH